MKYQRVRRADRQPRALRELARHRGAAMAMALVSMALVAHRRMNYDSLVVMACEFGIGAVLLATIFWQTKRGGQEYRGQEQGDRLQSKLSYAACTIAIVATPLLPWIADKIARASGFGNGFEIVMLSSLGWTAAMLAVLAKQMRIVGLSIICSGFLTLFSTFIADSSDAVWLTMVWGVLCLWWLVAKQWEQVEATSARRVQRTRAQQISTVALGVIAFVAGSLVVSNRIPVLRKLTAELMSTSGGSSDKDSAARQGVGNGDALVAARNHATSFGAVETDIFLDSEKPSLFDVFSDEFGEPRKKNKRFEQAQALSPQDIQSEEGHFTEANRASSTVEFSIERELPQERKPVNDLVAESLMFWQGERGAHLAAQRFTRFEDGVWSTEEADDPPAKKRNLKALTIEEQCWFERAQWQVRSSISPFVDAVPESLKFTRYRSPVIPSRAGLQMWCIDQIDRSDFFAITALDCVEMPGREHVPDYTVVRMIDSRIDLERLEEMVQVCSPGRSHSNWEDGCKQDLNQLAHKFSSGTQRGWDQVQSIIAGLRSEFQLDRQGVFDFDGQSGELNSALTQFLELRRGPDYMFATAAALMLDHLGYRTRLVAGFYANPKHYLSHENEIAILPEDAHVWLEFNAGHGYWVPLEPTPGYAMPKYSAGLWYYIKRNARMIAFVAVAICCLFATLYALRAAIVEAIVWLLLPARRLLTERGQIAWLSWLVDIRCRLAGLPRRMNVAPRQHLREYQRALPNDLAMGIQEFLCGADQLYFGGSATLSATQRAAVARVWSGLTVKVLKRSSREVRAK